ncbi:MAG: hypothetical protein ACOCQL_04910 [Halolamina sp.]
MTVFDWLFPGWTGAGLITLIVTLRTLCNVGLTAAVREASDSALAVVAAAALTCASLVLTVGVIRGAFGITVSHVESLIQVTLLVLAGVVVARGDGSKRGRNVAVLAGAGAVVLYLFSIPLFGEATVAP